MYEIPKIKSENLLADKTARKIFEVIKEYAQYRREGALFKKTVDLIEREINEIEKNQKLVVTNETYSRVRKLASEELFKKKDSVISSYIWIYYQKLKKAKLVLFLDSFFKIY